MSKFSSFPLVCALLALGFTLIALSTPGSASAQLAEAENLSPVPRAVTNRSDATTTVPEAIVEIQATSKNGTSAVVSTTDPTAPPLESAPPTVTDPSLKFAEGREGVITVAAKYVLPKPYSPHGMTAGSFQVSTVLPAGLTFVRATSEYEYDITNDYGMSCAADGQTVHCTVTRQTMGASRILRSGRTMRVFIVVKTQDNLIKPDATAKTDITQLLGDITASVAVHTEAGKLTDTATKPAIATAGYQLPFLATTLEQISNRGHIRTFHLVFHNIGGLPAVPVGKNAAIWFTEMLPGKDPAVPFSITGKGWTCDEASQKTSSPTRCWTKNRLEVGAASEPLTVTWYPVADRTPSTPSTRGQSYKWDLQTKASWTTMEKTTATGKAKRVGGQRCQSHPYNWRLHHLTPARLDINILAANGIDIRQSGSQSVALRVSNIGQEPAKRVGIRILLPALTTLTTRNPNWTCTMGTRSAVCTTPTTLNPGKHTGFNVTVTAADNAKVGRDRLRVAPFAARDIDSIARSVPMVIKDIGDPEATPTLQFARAGGGWRTWSNGSIKKIQVGEALTYRALIVNRGGNVVPASTTVRIAQAIGSGVSLVRADASNGGTCSLKPLACTITPVSDVAVGQQIGTVTITVIPRTVTKQVNLGAITTTVDGEPGNETVDVTVHAIPTDRTIRVSSNTTRIPDIGGFGDIDLRVVNLQPKGSPVENIVVNMPLPKGIVVDSVEGSHWTCTTTSGKAQCRFDSVLPGRTKSPVAHIRVKATGSASETPKPLPLIWRASGTAVGSGHYEYGVARLRLPIRKAIRIRASAMPTALAAAKSPQHVHSVVLTGSESTGNGVALDYHWRQRCTTASDVAGLSICAKHGLAPKVRVTSPTAAVARALVPSVTQRTMFVFELTITDGSSTQSEFVTVSAAAKSKLKQGGEGKTSGGKADTAQKRASQQATQRAAENLRQTHAKQDASNARSKQSSGYNKAKAQVVSAAKVAIGGASLVLGAPKKDLQLSVAILKGSGPHKILWQQVGGTPTGIQNHTSATATVRLPATMGVVTYTATVTNPRAQNSVAQITVNVGSTTISRSATPKYCSFVTTVGAGKSLNLAPTISATFGKVSAPPAETKQSCTSGARSATRQSTSGSFSASTYKIGSLTITNAAGNYSPAGIEITSGTLKFPAAWNMAPISVGTTPLSLVFSGNGQATQLTGSISTPSFAFLTLPTGWSGTTRLTFVPGNNGQTTGRAEMTALDGNGGTVALSGTMSTSGSFSLNATADKLITVGSTPLDFSGSVSNATGATGATVSQISGSIAKPITLATGVQLTTLTATWNGGTQPAPAGSKAATTGPVVTGQTVVSLQSSSETPIALTANLSYTSTTNWSVTLTASGGPTWQPVSGLQVQPSNFSGAIAQVNGAWQWNIKASIPTWNVTSILTLTNITLDLTNSCPSTTLICPKSNMFMQVSTNVALNVSLSPVPNISISAEASAIFGIGGSPGFSLHAELTKDLNVVPGVSLGSPSFAVNYGLPSDVTLPTTGLPSFSGSSDGGWNINVLGSLTVPGLGDFSSITASFSQRGVSLGGWDPNGVSLGGPSNGSQSGTAFGWSSFAANMTANLPNFGMQTIRLKPGMFSIQGSYTAPTWWAEMTKPANPLANMLGIVQFDPATGFFKAKIDFGSGYSIPAGGSSLAISSLFFEIQLNTTGLTVSAGGVTDLSVSALGGSTQTAPTLTFEISYDIALNALSGTLEFQAATGWNDAFGVDGLVIDDLAISLGITLLPPIPLPSIGLYASGELPPSLTQAFGVESGVPISMTAKLSESTPCLAIAVGSSTGTNPIMSVGEGAVTASYFEFAIAPNGCTVGSSTIPAGMSLAFDGTVFGTTVDVAASLSLNPTIFVASLTVGAFSVPGTGGSISFQNTTISVNLNAATNTDSVAFSGGFSMFGTTIDVSGQLTKSPTSVNASLKVSQPQPLTVAGFSLSNLMIAVDVEYGPGVEKVSVAASGNMNVMGTTLAVGFAAKIDNGIVEYVNVRANLENLTLGPATMNGTFNGSYTAATNAFDVNAAVNLTVGGFSMQATLAISPQCVAFTGSLVMPNVFTAQLAGTMIYQDDCTQQVLNGNGQLVNGSPGDFSFGANNVKLQVAGFEIGGSVNLGSVGGTFYAGVTAKIDLSPQSGTDLIEVQGSFDSTGNFAFAGHGNLDIAGFYLDVAVAVSNQNGNQSVSGSATLNLSGVGSVFISGQFVSVNGQVSTTLTGAADITLGGFNVANTTFTLSQTPAVVSLQAALAINVGVASVNGTATFIGTQGSAPLYYLAADGNLNIPIADLTLSAIFTNCTDSTCSTPANATSLTMSGKASIGGTTFALPSFYVDSAGNFSITSNAAGSACTGTITIPLVTQVQGCFSYTQYLLISNNSPYFKVSVSATLTVNGARWDFLGGPESCCCEVCWGVLGCTELCVRDGGWTNWENWGSFSAGIRFTADPFSLGIQLFDTWFEI